MHLSIHRKVRYIASSIRGPFVVVFTTSSSAIIISAPILFCEGSGRQQIAKDIRDHIDNITSPY